MKPKRAFTLVELLVVISIIALLVTIIMPTLGRAKELAKRGACAGNLNAVVKGLETYAAGWGGKFPTCEFDSPSRFDVVGDALTSRKFGSNEASSNSRNLYLAIRTGDVDPEALVCPAVATDKAASRGAGKYWDFNCGNGNDYVNRCSYSYHVQFRSGHPLTMASNSAMAVLADKSPFVKYPGSSVGSGCQGNIGIGGGEAASTNSPNHGGEGQNVAYPDGHVSYEENPCVGVDGDNIYTVWDGENHTGGTISSGSVPQGLTDSFLGP